MRLMEGVLETFQSLSESEESIVSSFSPIQRSGVDVGVGTNNSREGREGRGGGKSEVGREGSVGEG